MLEFTVTSRCGIARAGTLKTPHGPVDTPAFMPVGTAATVKGVTPDQLAACGAQMVLANTYHLMLRPGAHKVAALGGVRAMMSWPGPILTDSGGYQVFSLAHLRELSDAGVRFRSHIDGAEALLTPQSAIEIQRLLGADVIMQLDECPPPDASREAVTAAVRRSADWAHKCAQAWNSPLDSWTPRHGTGGPQALFGIQQGGVHLDLRQRSAQELAALDLPGYAIGGLSVGEGHEAMVRVLEATDSQLPAGKPRYLMGVGEPRDMLAAVALGVDMFDCVLPTRNGRNAQAFTFDGRVRLRNACWADDRRPLESSCDCYACAHFSRGTLRHLFAAQEMLGPTLVSIHNLRFFARLMAAVRQAITAGQLDVWSAATLDRMYRGDDEGMGA
jgi:queuine tRNA-ribosyltransferase